MLKNKASFWQNWHSIQVEDVNRGVSWDLMVFNKRSLCFIFAKAFYTSCITFLMVSFVGDLYFEVFLISLCSRKSAFVRNMSEKKGYVLHCLCAANVLLQYILWAVTDIMYCKQAITNYKLLRTKALSPVSCQRGGVRYKCNFLITLERS